MCVILQTLLYTNFATFLISKTHLIEFSLQIINYSTKTDQPLIPRLMSDLWASRVRTNREDIY